MARASTSFLVLDSSVSVSHIQLSSPTLSVLLPVMGGYSSGLDSSFFNSV